MISTTANKSSTLFVYPYEPLEIDFGLLLKPINDDEFLKLSRKNQDLQIEMTKDGDLIITPGTGGLTGNRNARIIARAVIWAEEDGTGVTFDSDTIFRLPNGAKRLPDFSWVKNEKWNSLTQEQQEKIVPFAPDFLIELRSPTDSLEDLQAKMQEYIENEVSLGWLIDPPTRKIYVYRSNAEVEILENPIEISGEPLLKGFMLNIQEIW
ncbi:MAG: Uma2 family endonuclease [Acidobacteria bacterium]|nr:Uma2 family endonuclease [Acidobacteriota bacterium]